MKRDRLIAILAIVLALTLGSHAGVQSTGQKPEQGVIRLSAELVQIDVLVTDKANRPVAGLKREDFQLYDNNKLQNLTAFAYEESKPSQFKQETAEGRTLPRSITAAEVKRVLAFVVDTLHMNFTSVYAAQRVLTDFIDHKMEPGDLVLILPTGGGSGLFQQFTSDQRVLRRAVSRLRPIIFTNSSTAFRTMSSPMGGGLGGGAATMGGGRAGGLAMPRLPSLNSDPLEEADARATIGALTSLIKYMSKLPGRKIGVLVSEGFRIFQTRTTTDLTQMTAQAARANVVFYTIDPRGLDPLMLTAAEGTDPDVSVTEALDQKRSDFFESQDSLNAIALDTGGKYFRNNNDISRGLNTFLQENSAYYLLGFQPEAARWDSKIHRIKVVVRNRPDLNVSFRKSYLAKTIKPEAASSADPRVAELTEALSSPLVRRDIDLRLTPFYLDDANRDPVLTALLHIDASRLSFKEVDGRYKTSLEEVGFIFDSTGKMVDKFSQTVDLNLLPQTYEQSLKRGFVISRRLKVKPGVYQVNMFVREPGSGLIGTANDFFEVPAMKGDRLAVSSIFTSASSIENGKVVKTAGEDATLSQRRFSRNGEFTYWLVIYNARVEGKNGQPQLEMRSRVLTGGRAVFTGDFHPVEASAGSTPPSRITTGWRLALNGLKPDDYTLEVTVRDPLRKKDKNATIRQEIDFTVE